MAFEYHDLLILQSSTTSSGLCGEHGEGAGAASQASTDTFPWGKPLWAGMSVEKSRGATLCFQGGTTDQVKSVSACSRSGQAGLSLAK